MNLWPLIAKAGIEPNAVFLIDIIVEAAKILNNQSMIKFILIGEGQTRIDIESLIKTYNLKNIEIKNKVPEEKLIVDIEKSDVCLGIFNSKKKALSVIPQKVLFALSSQKPLITANTPAVKEAGLENEKNCILVEPENSEDLARSILLLKNNKELREKIAIEGYKTFHENLSMKIAGETLVTFCKEILDNNLNNTK